MSKLKKRILYISLIGGVCIIILLLLPLLFSHGYAEYSEQSFFVDERCRVIEVKNIQPKDSGIVQIQIKIFIDEEDMPILEIADLTKATIETYVKRNKVNGVTACAYRKEKYEIDTTDTNNACVIINYAPQGNMLMAGRVEAGDYSTFKYKRLW